VKRPVALAAAFLLAGPVTAAHAAPVPATTTRAHHTAHRRTIADAVVRYARRFVGVPYVWGGSTPAGFDCSGFTRFVYGHFGIGLPHSSYAQWDLGAHPARSRLRPGDLVFFGLSHVGMWVGHGRFIHAPETGELVRVDRLAGWYGAAYTGAVRLRPAQRLLHPQPGPRLTAALLRHR
jgi:peptidoglycan DL-endopeptidase CwlO